MKHLNILVLILFCSFCGLQAQNPSVLIAKVTSKGLLGLVAPDGRPIVSPQYDYIEGYSEDLDQ